MPGTSGSSHPQADAVERGRKRRRNMYNTTIELNLSHYLAMSTTIQRSQLIRRLCLARVSFNCSSLLAPVPFTLQGQIKPTAQIGSIRTSTPRSSVWCSITQLSPPNNIHLVVPNPAAITALFECAEPQNLPRSIDLEGVELPSHLSDPCTIISP